MVCNDALCRVARVGLPARLRVFSARWDVADFNRLERLGALEAVLPCGSLGRSSGKPRSRTGVPMESNSNGRG